MGKNARNIVETAYGWKARLEDLHDMLTAGGTSQKQRSMLI
jgi:hypothetical protein